MRWFSYGFMAFAPGLAKKLKNEEAWLVGAGRVTENKQFGLRWPCPIPPLLWNGISDIMRHQRFCQTWRRVNALKNINIMTDLKWKA